MLKWLQKPKLSSLLDKYLQERQLALNTVRLTKTAWGQLIEAVGDMRVSRFNQAQAVKSQKFWTDRVSATSARIYHKMVSPVFSWCVHQGYIKSNPFFEIRKPAVKKRLARIYELVEFVKLIKACNDLRPENRIRWVTTLLLARTTGMRKAAIQNLCREDIDFGNETITVRAKTADDKHWNWQPKNSEERIVPLVKQVAQLLTELVFAIPQTQPYVLLKPARYYHLLEMRKVGLMSHAMTMCPITNFDKTFRRLKKKTHVKGRFHDFRATCLTDLSSILTIKEIAEIAGHSNLETTMVYLGVKDRRDAIDRARKQVSGCLGAYATPSHALQPN